MSLLALAQDKLEHGDIIHVRRIGYTRYGHEKGKIYSARILMIYSKNVKLEMCDTGVISRIRKDSTNWRFVLYPEIQS